MLGDAWDLVALLGAAQRFFIDNPELPNAADPAPSEGIVADLALAAWRMLAAFVSTDFAYRKAHNLTTDPKHQRRVSTSAHEACSLLMRRQPAELLLLPVLEARSARITSLLTSRVAAADPNCPAFGTIEWSAFTLLRLEDGDAGHELWARHRGIFQVRLARARQRWAAEPGVVSTAEQLCEIPLVGPYGGQRW